MLGACFNSQLSINREKLEVLHQAHGFVYIKIWSPRAAAGCWQTEADHFNNLYKWPDACCRFNTIDYGLNQFRVVSMRYFLRRKR